MSKSTQCYCIMFLLIASSISPAQEWVARYDGIGNEDDYARAIAVDDGGNVYVTGESDGGSSTHSDYATIKYNSSGIEQWVVIYDNVNWPYNDGAEAIAVDASGRILSGGYASTVKVDAACARGSYLKASATTSKATPSASFEGGTFGIALSSTAGVGTVSAYIFSSGSGGFLPTVRSAPVRTLHGVAIRTRLSATR